MNPNHFLRIKKAWLSAGLFIFMPYDAYSHGLEMAEVGTFLDASLAATWRDEGANLESPSSPWQIPGALMGGEAFAVEEGVSLDDANLVLRHFNQNGIYGLIQISTHSNGDQAEVHHAFAGYRWQHGDVRINAEAGRMAGMFSPFNPEHASTRLFSESAIAMDVFLGRQLNDEGMRASVRWQGWMIGAEGWRGSGFPATPGDGGGAVDVFGHYQWSNDKIQIHTGAWWLQADALDRIDNRYSSGHSHGTTVVQTPEWFFSGETTLTGVFVRTRWQLAKQWNLLFDAQWIEQTVEGTLADTSRIADLKADNNGGWIQPGIQYGNHTVALRWEELILENALTGAGAEDLVQTANLQHQSSDPSRLGVVYYWQSNSNIALRVEWTQDDTLLDQRGEGSDRFALGVVWNLTQNLAFD